MKFIKYLLNQLTGSFMVTSKLVDEHGQPFYTWNWWYESTSGSIQFDSEIREDLYKLVFQKFQL